MTNSWLAAAAWQQENQDFTPDALPAATIPIYPGLGPAHSMPDCILRA